MTRRDTLKTTLAASFLALLPQAAVPARAEGEVDVPFTDYPADYKINANPKAENRFFDIRTLDGHITPNDKFFFIQHYNRPEIDGAAYRLKLTGMVNKPVELSLADLKGMKSVEVVNGYECSGNSARFFDGLTSCGKFTGVPLRDVLKHAGVGSKAREVVFFGTDRKKEDVVFRQDTFKVEQQFGRSITLENALKPDPLLAYSLNGQPLTRDQG
ncbi:MAG TPA: molybdopterin-dependent oxidoreductase, partial [Bryobacteraceae bacterium]|nr:molybdopterin-dependent oxidoreductase [Bryobacteraceae bacterium]